MAFGFWAPGLVFSTVAPPSNDEYENLSLQVFPASLERDSVLPGPDSSEDVLDEEE